MKKQQPPQQTKKYTQQLPVKSGRKIYLSTDRVIDSVPCPPAHLLTIKEIFGTSG